MTNYCTLLLLIALVPNVVFGEDTADKNLVGAVYKKDLAAVQRLLNDREVVQQQLNPECPPNTRCKPITFAAESGSVEMTKLLLDAGANINGATGGSGDTPLILAIMNKHVDLVQFLLERGADPNLPNHFGATPFWGACAMGDEKSVTMMLKRRGVNVDQGGRFPDPLGHSKVIVTGITPLMFAVKSSYLSVAKALLDAGPTSH